MQAHALNESAGWTYRAMAYIYVFVFTQPYIYISIISNRNEAPRTSLIYLIFVKSSIMFQLHILSRSLL